MVYAKDWTPEQYLTWAYRTAAHSPDPSTQNGAVIAIPHSAGVAELIEDCNRFPTFVECTPERLERPIKYAFIEHAERNAIYKAARFGHALNGLTMYCPWFACADCARGIIQSGITRVIGHKKMFDQTPEHWKESIANAFTMFKEAKVEFELIECDLPEAPKILFNGELWQP